MLLLNVENIMKKSELKSKYNIRLCLVTLISQKTVHIGADPVYVGLREQ